MAGEHCPGCGGYDDAGNDPEYKPCPGVGVAGGPQLREALARVVAKLAGAIVDIQSGRVPREESLRRLRVALRVATDARDSRQRAAPEARADASPSDDAATLRLPGATPRGALKVLRRVVSYIAKSPEDLRGHTAATFDWPYLLAIVDRGLAAGQSSATPASAPSASAPTNDDEGAPLRGGCASDSDREGTA